MKTLYDLLGALPDDNADGLREAFRRAAKATHPDANLADPDAPLRFRQVMRANAILSDPQQRAAYDRLMVITAQEAAAAAATVRPQRRTVGAPATFRGTIRKTIVDAVAVAALSTVSIGGYLVFDRLSNASTAQSGSFEVASRPSAANAAVAPMPLADTAMQNEPAGAGAADVMAASKPVAPGASGAAAAKAVTGAKSIRRAFADIKRIKRAKLTDRSVKRTRTAATAPHRSWPAPFSPTTSTWLTN